MIYQFLRDNISFTFLRNHSSLNDNLQSFWLFFTGMGIFFFFSKFHSTILIEFFVFFEGLGEMDRDKKSVIKPIKIFLICFGLEKMIRDPD